MICNKIDVIFSNINYITQKNEYEKNNQKIELIKSKLIKICWLSILINLIVTGLSYYYNRLSLFIIFFIFVILSISTLFFICFKEDLFPFMYPEQNIKLSYKLTECGYKIHKMIYEEDINLIILELINKDNIIEEEFLNIPVFRINKKIDISLPCLDLNEYQLILPYK